MDNATIGVVVESILAVIIALTVIYLAVTAKPIPEMLSQAFMVILGVYFTKRVSENVRQTTKPVESE